MAAIHPVVMPVWGVIMTEGTVVKWLVAEGDDITPELEIVEIETTKVTGGLEAGVSGKLRRIVADNGSTLPTGALIAVISDPEVPEAEIESFVAGAKTEVPTAPVAPPQPATIRVGDIEINALRLGEDLPGTPLLLLHGFGGDLNTWLFNHGELASDRQVVAVDLPGHGGSSLAFGSGDLASLAGIVAGTLDALGISRVHVAGHSLGGGVALKLAELRSDRLASLTLIAPVGLGAEIGGNYIPDFIAADRTRAIKDVLGRLFADSAAVSRDMVEGVQRFKRLDGAGDALRTIADAVFPDGRQKEDLRRSLGQVPAMVIRGEADRLVSASHVTGLPASVEVITIADAGHMPQMEQPGPVNQAIRRQMAKADA
ncbi:MAG: acetoin dehydrogenase dihydrolipoyllysine-residue acetyltransferase subunit [Rhizobiales bacterium]|nr:acetoin dehydrogenase dihydrolipoyllysine-residue acetyltransferase subunit [Hyphomicrobiales bacterium]MBN9010458.1 acetoin dehydrogenase dihydrolipoyllysine-residue acetyltransferase subunit [Hyphomicrobiales bacterium]